MRERYVHSYKFEASKALVLTDLMPRHGCCRVSLRPGLGVPNKTALSSMLILSIEEALPWVTHHLA